MKGDIISPIKLTIGILISNRIQYIRRVMEGIKPLLENIPSELIAIDTKGAEGDGSIAIVKEYTDKVYSFRWCNDFAKARNVIFEHAQGEWFLAIDDDEVLEGVQEVIDFFRSGISGQYRSGKINIRNYDAENNYTEGTVIRLFRRTKNTRYVGAIHEYIEDAGLPIRVFSCTIHHYGYAFKNIEDAIKHQERNVRILKKAIEEHGYTPHFCAQMTQELIYLETSTDEGMKFAQKVLGLYKEQEEIKNPLIQYVMYATVLYYIRKQDVEHAVQQIIFLQENYPLLEVTKMVLFGLHAELALAQKNLKEMLQQSLNYIEYWDWGQKHKEEVAVQQALRFSQYCREEYYYHILHIGAAAANEMEKFRVAQTFWRRIPWKTEGFDALPYQQDLKNTLQGYKRIQLLQKQYPEIIKRLEILDQARLEVKRLEALGQSAVAAEYKREMKQLLEMLYRMLQPLLHENSQSILQIKNSLSMEAMYDIPQIKEEVQKECETLLDNI